MARRPPAPNPAPPNPNRQLTKSEIQKGIERLKQRITEIESYNVLEMNVSRPPEIAGLEVSIQSTLERIFGTDTSDFRRFSDACKLQWESGIYVGNYPALPDYQEGIQKNIQRSVAILQGAVRALEEEAADMEVVATPDRTQMQAADHSKIFVVHGHDEAAREMVARFLERVGIQPIILHEQTNRGRTVIEKVEEHGKVGFAVILLTPDDVGCTKDGTPMPRARQNVILELGYFIGRLGRHRVCALKRGELEIPSDFSGVVYETFDDQGGWRQKLAAELQAAGFSIDWNKVMRTSD